MKIAQMDKKPRRQYPIEEIMLQLECSKRSAYDYSNALDALDMCKRLSDDVFELLLAKVASGELKKR